MSAGLRVMIAGGGTGGHVYPGIAIYNALKRAAGDVQVLFVGAKAGVEARIFEDLDLPHVLLAGRGVRGTGALAKLVSPFLLLGGIVRGVKIVMKFHPDVVIGTGGYASVAVVAASVLTRQRRVLQEQNSVPGMANRVLSRFAHLVLLSFAESRRFFGRRVPCAVVGNPLRIRPDSDRAAALQFFELEPDLPTVFFFGGSRGAHAINQAACSAIARILNKRRVQFVILTGQSDYEETRDALAAHSSFVRVLPFLEEIQHAYSVADIAVARAGASSVFELAAFGVPTVFVPYPYAADDHQMKNVAGLAGLGAALVLENHRVNGEALEAIITSLLEDDSKRRQMAEKMRGWSIADADDLCAQKIVELVGGARVRAELSRHVSPPAHLGGMQ
jgi:UDP-N-acetylglucosamine--N-acetylmuramyl-(pentapeptide) pyrophosphoryl-undecaprenol N-acetylglucosamine transferase